MRARAIGRAVIVESHVETWAVFDVNRVECGAVRPAPLEDDR